MERKGYINIEDAIEAAEERTENIVTTNCELCGREFYAIRETLYKENIADKERVDLHRFELVTTVKCPHCGYSGKVSGRGSR